LTTHIASLEEAHEINAKRLLEAWRPNVEAVLEAKGTSFKKDDAVRLAIMLESCKREMARYDRKMALNETTQPTNIGPFKRYAFDILTAVMPNIIANELVSVQPMKQKIGQIFFLNYLFGSNKGATAAGSTMFNWQQVGQTPVDTAYTSDAVNQEYLAGAGTKNYSGNLAYIPVTPGTIQITTTTGANITVFDDGNGNLTDGAPTPQVSGTINYTTGAYSITFLANTTQPLTANYSYNLETAPSTIPQIDIRVDEQIIQARPRKLRALYAFDASYDLEMSQGINIDDALLQAVTSEIKHEIDGEILNDLYNQAAQTTNWNRTVPTGVAYRDWKDTFIDSAISAGNMIFQQTRRAVGNFMVLGKYASDIVESLGSRFQPSGVTNMAGPYFAGILDGRWKVYKNPFYNVDQYLIGYKGDLWLDAGYVYAPYLPIFATSLLMMDDFVGRRGFATSYGKKMLNNLFYVKGNIQGTPIFPM
jgi:hypothetical protein